jgi:DNA ligase-1
MKKIKDSFKKEPMLASPAPANPSFPIYASVKLDGIRCVLEDGKPTSRSGKLIPNEFVQNYFKLNPHLSGLDGELVVGDPNAVDVFRVTTSGVMSEDGEPDFTFYVFDDVTHPNWIYTERQKEMWSKSDPRVQFVDQKLIRNSDELDAYEAECLGLGYEGLVLRKIDGYYKFGRSTTKEGLLLKLKRFTDSEAIVTGFTELFSNQNEAKKDAFGRTERSSHKENQVAMDTLGALIAVETDTGREFQIGTGFDQATRKEIWKNQSKYKGKWAKYKFFKIGVKDLPRHPVFLGWRDKRDMS